MVCDICGKSGARQRYISRSYGKGESLLVIEGVPVISCSHCGGESYLTAHTLHEIEHIIVNLRINETLQTGAVKNRTYRGAKVSVYFLNLL